MEIINRKLDLHEFRDYIATYNFGTEPANKLVIHHTWRPTKEGWGGAHSIQGLKRYYEGKDWPAGPHLFIAEDGIWLFSPMRADGIHAGELNHRSIGIEVVGDYDQEKWSGKTKENALGTIKLLMKQLGIVNEGIYFHRDVSGKTCPGTAITKEWLFEELISYRLLPRLPGTAPIPELTTPSEEIRIPLWAAEAVTFVQKHQLFNIETDSDVREAVKFHRFYKLIKEG